MSNFLEKIIGDFEGKREWKEMKARAGALPGDYRMAYEEIQKYLWKTSGVTSLEPFKNLLDLFEESAANGRSVLEITGEDVAAFADELVRGEESYFIKLRKDLNGDIQKKLGKGNTVK
jgi:DNA-binding ferritin-like protein (Dps family)